jgi:parallel beta-helix repeat protein
MTALFAFLQKTTLRFREGSAAPPRRKRAVLLPESLEGRICLSTTRAPLVAERLASGSPATDIARSRAASQEIRLSLENATARVASRASRGSVTVNVNPRAKSGPKSLATAVKTAKPGERIVLAPGIYTQNVVVNNKSNITIVGAANQSSILSPANGDAIAVRSSSNVTIENVWFRSQGSKGRGLSVLGSSITIENIQTNGTYGDGVFAASLNGTNSTLTAVSCHFDGSQTGSGLNLKSGVTAMISGSTFNGNGTAPNVTQSSVGLGVGGNCAITVVNSQFSGNTNAGLVALESATVSVTGSTFSNNQKGDGALFLQQANVDLVDDTFSSNGEIPGADTGFNGVEFLTGYSGNATVTGSQFLNNTAFGVFSGGSANNIQITNNVFDNNLAGVFLDASDAPITATVQGNTFVVPASAPDTDNGFLAVGAGVTATVGGAGALENTFEDYQVGHSILQGDGYPNESVGNPNDTILTNIYLSGGLPIPASEAVSTYDG